MSATSNSLFICCCLKGQYHVGSFLKLMGSIPSVVTGEKMLQLIRKQIKLSQLSIYIRTKNHFNSWWSFAFGPKKNTIFLLFYAEGLFYKVIFLAHSLSWAWPEGGRRGREGREGLGKSRKVGRGGDIGRGGRLGREGGGGGPSEDSSLYPMSDGRIGE